MAAETMPEDRGEHWRRRSKGDAPAMVLMVMGALLWWLGGAGWVTTLGAVLFGLGLVWLLARNVLMWRR